MAYVPNNRMIAVCIMESDEVRVIKSFHRNKGELERIYVDDNTIPRSALNRKHQYLYKLSDEEIGLFLIELC